MYSFVRNSMYRMGCICSKETIEINNTTYHVRDVINGGGFSTIYFVEQSGSKKKFAIKKIVCHGSEDENLALQEIEYHKMLDHPNILPCLDHAVITKNVELLQSNVTIVYMLLPLYDLGTLENNLKMREKMKLPFDVKELLELFVQICEGIEVFHNFRPTPLAHRDIKPSNILLSSDNTPVIMDLGSTSAAIVFIRNHSDAQKLQDYAASRCTITYRAPELFNVEVNAVIDQRTDVWSLGCLLYALCYYKSPFDYVHEKGDSVALAVVSERIIFPENHEAKYPQSVHNLILSLLRIDPVERPFIEEVKSRTNAIIAELENEVKC